MAADQIVIVNQLASRLENATSVERVYALQELQSHAKVSPDLVGSLSLKKVLDFLQEQGSAEEYQEALDLIYRLVKCKDQRACKSNSEIILGDVNAVELLLDLLNHEDLTVGVMTSQILTEIHACNGAALEMQIQQIPDGMNKLLQRLPDSAREEVRNQAIVLIQQLTSTNEEMKKTVVFNEGFEILFGIIQREGGFEDAGLVVQDCLHICNNILSDSETCQRLFYAMGTDWILRLADFFDPAILENAEKNRFSAGLDGDDSDEDSGRGAGGGWYEDPARLACAVLALSSLYRSLSTPNKKHQATLAHATSIVIPSAAFWVARRGPTELVSAGLSLLTRLVEGGNADVGHLLANTYIKVTPAVPRKNIPADIEIPSLTFGWKPLPNDDRKFISLLSLLVERYIFPAEAWDPPNGPVLPSSVLQLQYQVAAQLSSTGASTSSGTSSLAVCALSVFERILASDASISDLIIQYILAPPPPPQVDGVFADELAHSGISPHASQLESMRPLGSHVLRLLVEGCQKILDGSVGSFSSGKNALDVAERAANVLAVVFIHGSQLARELCTAVTTSHAGVSGGMGAGAGAGAGAHKTILPMLLFTAGRTARSAGGAGYPLLIALLRMLACIASDCEIAAKQMLDDPANLFVVDLATAASESAGVPAMVQVAACMFLGCCFEALPTAAATPPVSANGTASGVEESILNRKSFLGMIDGRIGLNRFTDILRKPLTTRQPSKDPALTAFFVSPDFQEFYQKQVEAIRAGIFEFYTGGSAGNAPGDAMQQQLIEMQKERIAELEEQLLQVRGGAVGIAGAAGAADAVVQTPAPAGLSAEAEAQLRDEVRQLLETADTQEAAFLALKTENDALRSASEAEIAELRRELKTAVGKWQQADAELSIAEESRLTLEERIRAAETESAALRVQLAESTAAVASAAEEVLSLKQSSVQEHQAGKQLRETLEQRDRKIELLVAELRAIQPADGQAERKIADLENRNAELKQQLWAAEAELEKAQQALAQQPAAPEGTLTDVAIESPKSVVDVSADFAPVARTILSLVHSLGLEESITDFYTAEESLRAADLDVRDKCRIANALLEDCSEALSTCVGTCSDFAEGAGFHNLEGDEGSVVRILDCCRRLRDAAAEVAPDEVEQLRLQVEILEGQCADEELARADLTDEIAALETQVMELSEKLKLATPSQQGEVDSLRALLVAEQEKHRELSDSSEQKIAALTEARVAADEKCAHLVRENEDMKAQLEGVRSSSNQSTAEVRTELENVRAQLLQAEHSVTDLNAKLKSTRESSAEALRTVAEEWAAKFVSDKAAEEEKVRLCKEEAEESRVSMQAKVNALEQAVAESQRRNEDLASQLANALQSGDQTAAQVQKDLEEVRAQLLNREADLSDLRKQLEASQRDVADANTAAVALKAQVEELTAKSDVEIANLTASLERLTGDNQKLVTQTNALETEIEVLKRDILNQVTANAEAAATWEVERASLLEKEASAEALAQADSEHRRLEAELNAVRAASESIVCILQGEVDAQRVIAGHFLVAAGFLRAELEAAENVANSLQESVQALDSELSATRERCAGWAADLDAQTNSTEEVQAQLDALHMQYTAESTSLQQTIEDLRSHCARSAEELSALRAANEEEFAAQDSRYAEVLVDLEQATLKNAEQERAIQSLHATIAAQKEAEYALRVEFTAAQEALLAEQQIVQQLRATYEASASSADALQSQEQELRRLTQSVDNLARDLNTKEQQVQNLTVQLRRREGENAGVLTTFESVKADLELLREENERLSEKYLAENKAVKDKEREIRSLQAALQTEKTEVEMLRNAQLAAPKVVHHAESTASKLSGDVLRRVESDLKELAAWLITTHHITDYKVTSLTHPDGTKVVTITTAASVAVLTDAFKVIEALRNCITWVVEAREGTIREKTKLLGDREQELVNLRRILLAFESSDARHAENVLQTPATPVRGGGSGGNGYAVMMSTPGAPHAQSTPTQKPAAGLYSGDLAVTPSGHSTGADNSAARWSGAKSALQHASPAAKQAAKLLSEVLKERSKLATLQEQHSDLLGLLAQQDVELSVFRDTIQSRLGAAQLLSVEEQARRNAIDLYGSYTQFRYDL